jgi:hypothetical protein
MLDADFELRVTGYELLVKYWLLFTFHLSLLTGCLMRPYGRSGQISLTVGKYVWYLVISRVIKSRSSTAACAPI